MNIWWYKDDKTGHLKQVEAVLDELRKDLDFSLKEIKCKKSPFKDTLNLLTAFFFKSKTNNPDILIGAGHNTYLKILADKVKFGTPNTRSIAVLKPSIFRSWFDLICAPEHDYDQYIEKNTFTFIGSLAKVIDKTPDNDIGLIAIGGKNKHYKFESNEIFKQIEFVLNLYQNKKWYIFNSRRTPKELTHKLNSLNNNLLHFVDIDDKSISLNEIIGKADIKFVSPDSVNLVFECLSSKGSTYLFYLQSKKGDIKIPNKRTHTNKIIQLMNKLTASRDVGFVDLTNVSEEIKAYSLKKPNTQYQLYAEVEKVAYKISNFVKQ
jgi:mitochondrial fission protein ELM1